MSRLDDLVTRLEEKRTELARDESKLVGARDELDYRERRVDQTREELNILEREIGKLSIFDEKTTMRVLAQGEP